MKFEKIVILFSFAQIVFGLKDFLSICRPTLKLHLNEQGNHGANTLLCQAFQSGESIKVEQTPESEQQNKNKTIKNYKEGFIKFNKSQNGDKIAILRFSDPNQVQTSQDENNLLIVFNEEWTKSIQIQEFFSNRPGFSIFYDCEFHSDSSEIFVAFEHFDTSLSNPDAINFLSKLDLKSRFDLYLQSIYQIGFMHKNLFLHLQLSTENIFITKRIAGNKLFLGKIEESVEIKDLHHNLSHYKLFPSFLRTLHPDDELNSFDDLFSLVLSILLTEEAILNNVSGRILSQTNMTISKTSNIEQLKKKDEKNETLEKNLNLFIKKLHPVKKIEIETKDIKTTFLALVDQILKKSLFPQKLSQIFFSILKCEDFDEIYSAMIISDQICESFGGCRYEFHDMMEFMEEQFDIPDDEIEYIGKSSFTAEMGLSFSVKDDQKSLNLNDGKNENEQNLEKTSHIDDNHKKENIISNNVGKNVSEPKLNEEILKNKDEQQIKSAELSKNKESTKIDDKNKKDSENEKKEEKEKSTLNKTIPPVEGIYQEEDGNRYRRKLIILNEEKTKIGKKEELLKSDHSEIKRIF